jgi:hypothetical protein
VLRVVESGHSLELTELPPFSGIRETRVVGKQLLTLEKEIEDLLEKDAIEKVPPQRERAGFYCTFFVVPKQGTTKLRPILNLKPLNRFIIKQSFKMESLRTVKKAVQVGDWLVSIDLKDAYLHVPIRPVHWKYLRFKMAGQAYQWKVLPFGLSSAPRVFSKVLAPLVAWARLQGIHVYPYLDDWLLRGPDPRELQSQLQQLIRLLQDCGWLINLEKSVLTPSQDLQFIGARFLTQQGLAVLPKDRMEVLVREVGHLKAQESESARGFLRVLGLMNACIEVVRYARLHMRPVQIYLLYHWRPSSRDLHQQIPVDDHLRKHLKFWESPHLLSQGVPLQFPPPQEILVTDASNLGYGGYLESGGQMQGLWSEVDLMENSHINLKEMEAVHRACVHFLPRIRGKQLLVRCDNASVVAYLNKEGGTRSPSLCIKTYQLVHLLRDNNVSLQSVHIKGTDNVQADSLSRRMVNPLEWQLKRGVVQQIFNLWGAPLIDLFASADNCQLPTFCSRYPHPLAYHVDALTLDWRRMYAYAYPPLSLLPLVFRKIRDSGCTVIVIAPRWPRRSWYTQILDLLVDFPIALPVTRDLLTQDRGRVFHPEPEFLDLVAWRLSSMPSLREEFRRRLQGQCCSLSDQVPGRPTSPNGQPLLAGVLDGMRIPIRHL